MLESFLVAIVSGILIFLITKSSIFKNPKVRISLNKIERSIMAVIDGYSQANWRASLFLTNILAYPAFKISIISHSKDSPFQRVSIRDFDLENNQKFEISATVSRMLSKDERKKMIPNTNYKVPEFESFSIVLKYENETGKKFYTKYTKNGKNEKCAYYLFRPFNLKKTNKAIKPTVPRGA